ncbi:hypothetical protein G5B40_07370 [Pikeienuella piscinae]|uniref:UPF0102 protein G5B40_07370 n=1 Tax=Pikeienuella piscinae TaxID=2748098 RepID=A0A7L5BUI7_9RHOB|nr:YraN family protein [Pikeienuella piscinae]QIE55292.1 hypothetical protein G5B40_07370 [Pikeienuella piscinae]
MSRAWRGGLNHRTGLAAEDSVARLYAAAGAGLLARRWRCAAGEIDLIFREPETIVFVEVKRREKSLGEDPVGERQWRRLEAAAETYMVESGTGDIPLRFDLALVGVDGSAEIIRNARIRG